MNYIKTIVYGPDPKEAFRKSKSMTRKNIRQLDREISTITQLQKKTETLIKQSVKKNELKTSKIYARELIKINKQKQRLSTSRATLQSINMQLDEQQQQLKLTNKLSQSTVIMKDVNSLIRIPAMSKTIRDLSAELTKSGIMTEMVDDSFDLLDDDIDEADSEQEEEVDKILSGFLESKDKVADGEERIKVNELISGEKETATPVQEVEDDEHEVNLMRERLKALQS